MEEVVWAKRSLGAGLAQGSSSPLKSTSRDGILRNWLPWQKKGS